MLYLPDFDLYTDPTASHASFATPAGEFLRQAGSAYLERRRPSGADAARRRPDDHVTDRQDDGIRSGPMASIKGTTRQTATGIFAISARGNGHANPDAGPREISPRLCCAATASPGPALFEPATPFDLAEPYERSGCDFSSEREAADAVQWPARRSRSGCRSTGDPALDCWGSASPVARLISLALPGKQVEEIELTFADGLPMPQRDRGRNVDSKYFSYQSHYVISGRTLTIRREFRSNVAGQVCAKEIESEIDRAAAGGCPQPANQNVVSAYCPEHGPSEGRMKSGGEDTPMLGRNSIYSTMLMAALCVAVESATIKARVLSMMQPIRIGRAPGSEPAAAMTRRSLPGLGQQAPLTPEFQKILEAKHRRSGQSAARGENPGYRCASHGMPRVMIANVPIGFVIMPETTLCDARAAEPRSAASTPTDATGPRRSKPPRSATRSASGSTRMATAVTTRSRPRPAA